MKINTIAASEIDAYVEKGNVLIVDLRLPNAYYNKHITGAINIPFAELDKRNFNVNQEIVLYCERGASSIVAASRLAQKGYNVKSVIGGISAYHGSFIS